MQVSASQVYNQVIALGGSGLQAQVAAALVSGIESDGDPLELAGGIGPAQGLFQFEPGTWRGAGGGTSLPPTVAQATWQQQVQAFINETGGPGGDNFGAWGPDLNGTPATMAGTWAWTGPPKPGTAVYNKIQSWGPTGIPSGASGGGAMTAADWAGLKAAVDAGGGPYLAALAAGSGGSMPNMTTADWQALYQASQQPGGAAYLQAAYEQAVNAQATGTSGALSNTGNAQAILASQIDLLNIPAADKATLQAWAYNDMLGRVASGMDSTTIGNQLAIDIQSTPIFEKYYPGIVSLRNQGLPPMSVAEYQSYTQTVQQAAADAGLPKGLFDTSTANGRMAIGNLVGNQLSAAEVTQRIKQGYEAVAFGSPNIVNELATYFPQIFPGGLPTQAATGVPGAELTTTGTVPYTTTVGLPWTGGGPTWNQTGGTQGALAAFFLDPNRAWDQMANMVTEAQIGAEGIDTGFGQITAQEAAQLQGAGFTQAEARSNFAKINKLVPLENQLPGVPGSSMSQSDLINYGFYGANPQELENVQGTRKAPFSGGGGYAQTARGAVGAGYASTQGIQGT